MKYRKDLYPLPKDFALIYNDVRGVRAAEPVLHFHDCLEINYIESGTGINIIEDKKFKLVPGDFYIINNLERHIAVSPDDSLRMKLIVFDPLLIWQHSSFDFDYLKPFFNRSIVFSNCVSRDNPLSPHLFNIICEIEYEWNSKQEGYRLVIKALLMKLLAMLYRHFKISGEISDEINSFHKSYDRIRDVINYINENFQNDLTLDELAKIAHMNKTYFSSYFKRIVQMNASEYVQNLRINYACSLLRTSNKEITEISSLSGFNSISHFNKSFRNYMNMTPKEYRNPSKAEQKTIIAENS